MCGICGWLNLKNELNIQTMVNMNNIAKHRGPDDEGYLAVSRQQISLLRGTDSCPFLSYHSSVSDYDTAENSDYLLMAHRRLSIIDLSPAGHQPMNDDSLGLAVTFNGEIYNYIELKEELIKKNYSFTTNSDTEVILKAYSEWGEECVAHFNGMWGFAIWDSKNRKLFCSRDRLGAKPFYYAINDDEFLFSSEIKQLCQNPHVQRILDEKTMVSMVMWGISDYSEDTLIKDIKTLQGGCNIVVQLDEEYKHIEKIRKYQYWDVNTEIKNDSIKEEIFNVLEDAIHIRTRSDAPIGVLLSGGLDSSCIVSEIADYYEKQGKRRSDLKTFTSCYKDFEEGDEKKYAEKVNSFCGATENLIYPDEQDTLTAFENLVWHLEGDCGFQTIGSYLLLRDIAKTGTKVLINGQGSDETQFGYERYYAWYFKDLIKKGKILELIKAFNDGKKNSRLSSKMLAEYFVYFSFLGVRKQRCLSRMAPYVNRNMVHMFLADKEVNKYINQKNMKELQYNELRNTQLTHILRMDDRLYMANSLESRVPFIDYRYIEKAVEIPENRKIQKGYTKYLLREHFEPKLPQEVIWRKNKMGWPSPKDRWVKRFDPKRMEDIFSDARTGKYFNIEALKKLYRNDPASYAMEKFLTVELFVRKFDVEITN